MARRRILISGAGIAGPALALALDARRYEVTVVERALALRDGGQAVDFRGPVHREVLERLALWDPIHARRTPGTDMTFIDAAGREVARLPSVMMSGDVEIVRGDLCALLHGRSAPHVSYRFGERVTRLEHVRDGVRATLSDGSSETYDLVVGADGLHSGVRALAFGEESQFLRHHGYRLAAFSMPNLLGLSRGAVARTVPGRSLMVSTVDGITARAQMIFEGAPLDRERHEPAAMTTMLRATYRDFGWEAPRILDALDRASDLYVDQIATVEIDRYSTGRVALLGDAAWGGTLGGQGTPLAIVGAYVLAGELGSGDDVAEALARYERRMRPYATDCQKGAVRAGPFFAPRTRLGLFLRDVSYRALTSRLLVGQFEKMVKASATAFALPAYGRA